MNLLLDTHVFIWWTGNVPRISPLAADSIASPDNRVFLSVASVWEMAIKTTLGRLELRSPLDDLVATMTARHRFLDLPIRTPHAIAVAHLARHHGDPFDRLLIAQAQTEDMRLVTADPAFARYDVAILW